MSVFGSLSKGIELLRTQLRKWGRLAFGDQRVVAFVSRFVLPKLKEAGCTHYCVGCGSGLHKHTDGTYEVMFVDSDVNTEFTHDQATHSNLVIPVPDHGDVGYWIENACNSNPDFPLHVEMKHNNEGNGEKKKKEAERTEELATR